MKILKRLNFVLFFNLVFFCLILTANASKGRSVDILKRDGDDNSIVNHINNLGVKPGHNIPEPEPKPTPDSSSNTQRKDRETIKLYSNDWWVAVYGSLNGVSKPMIALSTLMILAGLFLCTMGFHLLRPSLGVLGFLTFGFIMWAALANCRPADGYPNDTIIMIVVPMCVGIIGAIVYFLFIQFSEYSSAALGGLALALFICSWRYDLVIPNLIGRLGFFGGMALVSVIAARFLPRDSPLFTTSFVGSYIIMLGIDCLARKGYIAGLESLVNFNPNSQVEYTVSMLVYILLAMTLVLFFISYGWQFYFNITMPKLRQVKKAAIKKVDDKINLIQQTQNQQPLALPQDYQNYENYPMEQLPAQQLPAQKLPA